MKNFKKIGATLFLSAYLFIGVSFGTPVLAVEVTPVQFTPQIGIPGTEFVEKTGVDVGKTTETKVTSDLLARYIKAFYQWGLSIVGVVAVLILMAGGILWLTSGGDSGKISDAKKMIEGSLLGTFLLLGAYFFLNTINPDLTKLPVISMDLVKKISLGCCDAAKDDGKSKMTTSDNCSKGFSNEKQIGVSGKCEAEICCMGTASDNTKICFQSLPSSCDLTKASKKCSILQFCNGATDGTMTCEGVEDTESALWASTKQPVTTGNNIPNYWCYNQKIYTVKGKVTEPCGNEKYSKCDEDKEQNGKTCNGDMGGRSCNSGLWCCKFKADGTRINK